MKEKDLRTLLEQSDDKLGLFMSSETFKSCSLTNSEFLGLISDFLSDEEKLKLFDSPIFLRLSTNIKKDIIKLITNENVLLQILNNDNLINNFPPYDIVALIIKRLSDDKILQLLYHPSFLQKHNIDVYDISNIINLLSPVKKAQILMDTDLIRNSLGLENTKIVTLTNGLPNEAKITILLRESTFSKIDKLQILLSLDISALNEFILQHKDFFNESNICPYEIICKLDSKKQKKFLENLENLGLTLSEKKEILAMLSSSVKQSIDTTNLPEEYKLALSMQTTERRTGIIIDLDGNLENYRGFDRLIHLKPEEFTEEQRAKLIELCDICPDLTVINIHNQFVPFFSTGAEYKEAETWISSLINSLDSDYSPAQKLAVIDNAIGNKISYTPDQGTEVFDYNDSKALWKIVSSGYGVCNGIARLEQYILERIGIKSEIVSSQKHSFLKLIDIELPLADGNSIRGNSIIDPTWNLALHRFGAKPNLFCINYEQARNNDIVPATGVDYGSHINDEELQDATLNLNVRDLRALFRSVGLTDETGQFPIVNLFNKLIQIDTLHANNLEENIDCRFSLLRQVCPEFATCENSTMTILSSVIFRKFGEHCIVNRIYDKSDKEKRPIPYVYFDLNSLGGKGEKFYFLDRESSKFVETTKEEFINKFECYESDLKENNRS